MGRERFRRRRRNESCRVCLNGEVANRRRDARSLRASLITVRYGVNRRTITVMRPVTAFPGRTLATRAGVVCHGHGLNDRGSRQEETPRHDQHGGDLPGEHAHSWRLTSHASWEAYFFCL